MSAQLSVGSFVLQRFFLWLRPLCFTFPSFAWLMSMLCLLHFLSVCVFPCYFLVLCSFILPTITCVSESFSTMWTHIGLFSWVNNFMSFESWQPIKTLATMLTGVYHFSSFTKNIFITATTIAISNSLNCSCSFTVSTWIFLKITYQFEMSRVWEQPVSQEKP